jgi:hypothetical protein
VDDQVRVRVRDRVQDLAEQRQPLRGSEPVLVAVAIDAGPVDELEHQIGRANVPGIDPDPGVDEAGDVGMGEPRERAALPPEPLATHRVQQ